MYPRPRFSPCAQENAFAIDIEGAHVHATVVKKRIGPGCQQRGVRGKLLAGGPPSGAPDNEAVGARDHERVEMGLCALPVELVVERDKWIVASLGSPIVFDLHAFELSNCREAVVQLSPILFGAQLTAPFATDRPNVSGSADENRKRCTHDEHAEEPIAEKLRSLGKDVVSIELDPVSGSKAMGRLNFYERNEWKRDEVTNARSEKRVEATQLQRCRDADRYPPMNAERGRAPHEESECDRQCNLARRGALVFGGLPKRPKASSQSIDSACQAVESITFLGWPTRAV